MKQEFLWNQKFLFDSVTGLGLQSVDLFVDLYFTKKINQKRLIYPQKVLETQTISGYLSVVNLVKFNFQRKTKKIPILQKVLKARESHR